MVDKRILEYFRVNRGNYKLEDLKKKVLASGYSQQDVDVAIAQLNKQTGGTAPSINKTITQINKTNITDGKAATSSTPTSATPASASAAKPVATGKKSKKSKKWLWITLAIILLILIIAGGVIWFFFDQIKGLFTA